MYPAIDVFSMLVALILGIALLVAPTTIYRLHLFTYSADTGRHGPYGEEPEPSLHVRWLIRIIGAGLMLLAAYIAAQPWL